MVRKEFVSMNVTPEARDRLRLAALQIGLDIGKRISLADALLAALATAQAHPADLRQNALSVIQRAVSDGDQQEGVDR